MSAWCHPHMRPCEHIRVTDPLTGGIPALNLAVLPHQVLVPEACSPYRCADRLSIRASSCSRVTAPSPCTSEGDGADSVCPRPRQQLPKRCWTRCTKTVM